MKEKKMVFENCSQCPNCVMDYTYCFCSRTDSKIDDTESFNKDCPLEDN